VHGHGLGRARHEQAGRRLRRLGLRASVRAGGAKVSAQVPKLRAQAACQVYGAGRGARALWLPAPFPASLLPS
jgi:hypothetical protein